MSLVSIGFEALPSGTIMGLLAWLLYAPFYAIFAVTCHRVIILGPSHIPSTSGIYWSSRELRFIGWMLAVAILASVGAFIASLFTFIVPDYVVGFRVPWLGSVVGYFVVMYFVVRFSLVFPAAAVDNRTSLADSWNATSGNGAILALALTVPLLITLMIFSALDAAFLGNDGFLISIPYNLIGFVFLAFEIGVLSVAYKHIVLFESDSYAV
jgi:hypothetical protein